MDDVADQMEEMSEITEALGQDMGSGMCVKRVTPARDAVALAPAVVFLPGCCLVEQSAARRGRVQSLWAELRELVPALADTCSACACFCVQV